MHLIKIHWLVWTVSFKLHVVMFCYFLRIEYVMRSFRDVNFLIASEKTLLSCKCTADHFVNFNHNYILHQWNIIIDYILKRICPFCNVECWLTGWQSRKVFSFLDNDIVSYSAKLKSAKGVCLHTVIMSFKCIMLHR